MGGFAMCSTAVRDPLADMDILQVSSEFVSTSRWNSRDRAEMAFAIAKRCHEMNDTGGARAWAQRSIRLFKETDTNSEARCVPVHPVIAGIELPALIHEGVVKFHAETYWRISISIASKPKG
jgi:hypothetical protein